MEVEIKRLSEEGYSIREIAKMLDVTKYKVEKCLGNMSEAPEMDTSDDARTDRRTLGQTFGQSDRQSNRQDAPRATRIINLNQTKNMNYQDQTGGVQEGVQSLKQELEATKKQLEKERQACQEAKRLAKEYQDKYVQASYAKGDWQLKHEESLEQIEEHQRMLNEMSAIADKLVLSARAHLAGKLISMHEEDTEMDEKAFQELLGDVQAVVHLYGIWDSKELKAEVLVWKRVQSLISQRIEKIGKGFFADDLALELDFRLEHDLRSFGR